ncbi:MAG: hypothetical protein B7Y80_19340 [Hyphomicrobium sp. 32-62-53]|nr:MAG: hypothetical protein B7Z29_17865 [Hyphomicrobium sp. 12-62-95]OYX97574.1 MAG: hypothetical protein B7Y80_19340 [Hyphomicrobium sp. 32-62-53]
MSANDEPLHIPTTEYRHREVRILPRGGWKTTRVRERAITLPRISILSDEVAQFLASPIVPAQPTGRRTRDRGRRRFR